MALLSGIITYNKAQKYTVIHREQVKDFNIRLPKDMEYEIGIDQSTSCTGIYLQDTKDTINILLELEFANPDKKSYFRELFLLLRKLVIDIKVNLIVCEKPVPNMKQAYTHKVLVALFGKLESFLETEPSLQDSDLESIYPQVWKSKIIDKSKGKGRINSKVCTAEDLCDKKPLLRNYLIISPAKDLDGFDACGILLGYKKCAFNSYGNPQIYSEIEKRHYTTVFYRYLDMTAINSSDKFRDLLFGIFGETVSYYQPKYLSFNRDYNLLKNIKMASTKYKLTVTEIPSQYLESLRWEFGFDFDDNKRMFAYIVRNSEFRKADLKILRTIMPWVLQYGPMGEA